MPEIKKRLIIKPFKTIKENSKWKNLETINKKTKLISKNKDLEKLAEKWKLPWYVLIKSKDKEDFIKSIKNKTKIDNLDPKIAIPKPKRILKKQLIKVPRKIK